MPLVLRTAMVWAGATAAGLAGAPPWIAVALGAAALLVIARREASLLAAALAVLAVAGAAVGADLRRADARCLQAAAHDSTWALRLRAASEPGSFVRGEGVASGCHLDAWVAVRSGRASAGSIVRVTRAAATLGEGQLLLRDATLRVERPPDALARWRNATATALDARFGDDAPMVRALLIADTKGLSPALRERYADAGLVHLLSISGLHVAIIGGALLLLFRASRLPPGAAAVAAVGGTALYVLAIGAPPPALRSVTLFAATQLTRLLQRPVSPWGPFALGALVPLLAPRTVLDLGWQLSVAGYAAIVVSGRIGRRRLPESWRGWRRSLARDLVAGVLTTAATAPLVAWHFGRLSLVSPLSNLAAGPVVALLQPTLFLAMLAPGEVGAFAADASRPLLRALDAVAGISAGLPGASISVAPTRFAVILAVLAVGALLAAGWARHWRTPATVACAALAGMVWIPEGLPSPRAGMELHLLDVGQGDAVVIRSPRGRWIVVDVGRQWNAGDAGRATVIPYLRRRGGEVALLVLTHPHADHIGGARSLIRALPPRELRDAAFVEGSAVYRAVLQEAADRGVRWQRVRPGEVLDVDGIAVEFLAPDSAWTVALDDPNEASAVVRVRYGATRVLLTGDAERREEEWLLRHAAERLPAEVLKVGHHGSRTSSTPALVDAVAPRLALVSVGAGNTYGHPSAEVMARLLEAGATILRTDQLGTIVVRSDGESLEVEAAGARWRVARPLPMTP